MSHERNALVAIVNTRDGEQDNVWQRIARAALDLEKGEDVEIPVPKIRMPDIVEGMNKQGPTWLSVVEMLDEAWNYECARLAKCAFRLQIVRFDAGVVIDMLDNKPVGLDEGDWALVERLRKSSHEG